MEIRNITTAITLLAAACGLQGAEVEIKSPDGRNIVTVEKDGPVNYRLSRDNREIIGTSPIEMRVDGTEWGTRGRCRSVKRSTGRDRVSVDVPRRSRTVSDRYNGAVLKYGDYDIEFRVYDDGMAYRFVSDARKADKVERERTSFRISGNPATYTQLTDRLQQWFEYNYTERPYRGLPSDSLVILPALLDYGDCKVLLAESDVYGYPGMYLKKSGNMLQGEFAGYPETEKEIENGNKRYVDTREPYLIRDAGRRTFPWRIVATFDDEKDILASELVYLLASEPDKGTDYSWVRPGKVLWDWWNCRDIYGVDFRVGINTDTYLYMIDYAARNGMEYLLIDEGWSAPFDLLTLSEDVDMKRICDYARSRNVGILLWVKWVNLDRQMEQALDMMHGWGVTGIKVDFMDRNDAWMTSFFERTAREAAARQMMVNFHGCYPPDGMRRRYPNIMTREGVYGLENNKWSDRVTPRHDVLLAYIRQFSGPMDYTPGAMNNAHADRFRAIHDEPMSQGTRSHQVALYVVYESPLQAMADSPVHYDANPESRDFIKSIPEVWDETVPLCGRLGEYVAVARRNGDTWYVGALNGTDAPLHLELDLSFMGSGSKKIFSHSDGVNAVTQAKDFRTDSVVTDSPVLAIDMARGGGYAAIITQR